MKSITRSLVAGLSWSGAIALIGLSVALVRQFGTIDKTELSNSHSTEALMRHALPPAIVVVIIFAVGTALTIRHISNHLSKATSTGMVGRDSDSSKNCLVALLK